MPVSAEELIRALPYLHHCGAVFFRQFADIMHRHANRIGYRFILMINQVGQEIGQVLTTDENLMMVSAKAVGHFAGIMQLVELFHRSALVSDRIGLHRPIHLRGHQRHVNTGIDAA